MPAFGGLGPAPFGDRSARFAKLLANDFRVVVSIGVDRCGGMSAVLLRCLIAGSTYGRGFQSPPSALRANAAAAGLTIFRRARVTGWSVTLIKTSYTGSWRRDDSEIDRPSE